MEKYTWWLAEIDETICEGVNGKFAAEIVQGIRGGVSERNL